MFVADSSSICFFASTFLSKDESSESEASEREEEKEEEEKMEGYFSPPRMKETTSPFRELEDISSQKKLDQDSFDIDEPLSEIIGRGKKEKKRKANSEKSVHKIRESNFENLKESDSVEAKKKKLNHLDSFLIHKKKLQGKLQVDKQEEENTWKQLFDLKLEELKSLRNKYEKLENLVKEHSPHLLKLLKN